MNENGYDLENIDSVYFLAANHKVLSSLTIEILTACNWKCQHCYHPSHQDIGLRKTMIVDILNQARDIGVFNLTLTGGEIFLRADMIDIIEAARTMGFSLSLFSNLSLLDEISIRRLGALYISRIYCSIFSLQENIHDEITQTPGSLKKVMQNVSLIKQCGIPLTISTPLMALNYDSYRTLYEFCLVHGFQYRVDKDIFHRLDGDTAPLRLRMNDEQLLEVAKDTDTMIDFAPKERLPDDLVCPELQQSLFINYKGDILPCNRWQIKLGDIFNDGITYIWKHSKQLQGLRATTWGNAQACFNCKDNRYCIRCPGSALQEVGSAEGISPIACDLARARRVFREIEHKK